MATDQGHSPKLKALLSTPRMRWVMALAALALALAGSLAGWLSAGGSTSNGNLLARAAHRRVKQYHGIHKIRHIVIIMQENRSFDSYFGTYPGADGIPMHHGVSTVCVPDSQTQTCQRPYHDTQDVNTGGAHTQLAASHDIDGGKMDGFVNQVLASQNACAYAQDPNCAGAGPPDVMGYHTKHDIANYWSYAKHFVLQDHMFESTDSWSLPSHLYMVSAWAANCTIAADPYSCHTDLVQQNPPHSLGSSGQLAAAACQATLTSTNCQSALALNSFTPAQVANLERVVTKSCVPSQTGAECVNRLRAGPGLTTAEKTHLFLLLHGEPNYAWTDVTYLLHKHHVSWAYYVMSGKEPDCENGTIIGASTCTQKSLAANTPGIWNPLPEFTTVQQDHQLSNIKSLPNFYTAATKGTLPAVSWITPSQSVSEHPPASVSVGQSYVTGLINAIMRGPDWNSTAIFVSWDDWGGFYDHVVPPTVDGEGYGLRVPGLVISPYAKKGHIDHQTLSHDAYLKFIEDDFLGGQRLNPTTDGRPDPRPTVREKVKQLGNLTSDFNFNQSPRPPTILHHGKWYR